MTMLAWPHVSLAVAGVASIIGFAGRDVIAGDANVTKDVGTYEDLEESGRAYFPFVTNGAHFGPRLSVGSARPPTPPVATRLSARRYQNCDTTEFTDRGSDGAVDAVTWSRYNGFGLLEHETYDSGNDGSLERVREYSYDDRGRLTQSMTRADGGDWFATRRDIYFRGVLAVSLRGDARRRECTEVVTYTYDPEDGRALADYVDEGCTGVADTWEEHQYDVDGLYRGFVRYRRPDEREKVQEYWWQAGRIAEIRVWYPSLGPYDDSLIIKYVYDAEGRIIRSTTAEGIGASPDFVEWHSYVGADQLGETAVERGGVETLRSRWTYDEQGLPMFKDSVYKGLRTRVHWSNDCE